MKKISEETSIVISENSQREKIRVDSLTKHLMATGNRVSLDSVDDSADGALKRRFNSGHASRLNADVNMSVININTDLRNYWKNMVGASRELSKNNPFFVKYLQMREINIIGDTGVVLQSQVQDMNLQGKVKPDLGARRMIEDAFFEWCQRENCSVDGTMSFFDIQKMLVRNEGVDGEMFFQMVRNTGLNKFGFALQPLDPVMFEPTKYTNRNTPNGNKIVNGVELNPWGRPVAYWMLTNENESPAWDMLQTSFSQGYKSIPANGIIHYFEKRYPLQTRGIPKAHACMNNFAMLRGYSEAELVAARASASKFVEYFTDMKITDPNDIANLKEGGQFLQTMSAGGATITPYGYKMQLIDPKHPTQSYPEFVKAQLREISAALGVAYNSLANDLQAVNFSSLRSGLLEERDNWKMETRRMNEQFNDIVFREWLKVWLTLPTTKLPFSKFSKFYSHTWHGRTFDWVDPVKDLEAAKLELELKLTTPQELMAERGKDMNEIYEQWAEAKTCAEENGLQDPEVSSVDMNTNYIQDNPEEEKDESRNAEQKNQDKPVL